MPPACLATGQPACLPACLTDCLTACLPVCLPATAYVRLLLPANVLLLQTK